MDNSEEKFRKNITYLSSQPITCPVCGHEFYVEKMQTGSGRLIAGDITDLLHRKYKPSQKYGKIDPLIYSIITCPDCYYSVLPQDFLKIPDDVADSLKSLSHERIDFANKIIGEIVDFTKAKTSESGAAGYALAIDCYDKFPKKMTPVIKQAICSIRCGYIFDDLNIERPGVYYDYLASLFYKKALFFYKYALELNQSKVQIMENMKVLGPDIDKDYGYDGVTYEIATLTVKYGEKTNPEIRQKELDEAKLYFGKLFGMGKSNVNKPKEILEKSKDFFDIITKEMAELNG